MLDELGPPHMTFIHRGHVYHRQKGIVGQGRAGTSGGSGGLSTSHLCLIWRIFFWCSSLWPASGILWPVTMVDGIEVRVVFLAYLSGKRMANLTSIDGVGPARYALLFMKGSAMRDWIR